MNKYWTFLLFFLYACSPNKEFGDKTVISVAEAVGTGEILNLSDYAKAIEYIPLATNDSVLIGDIEELIYENGHIILHDFQGKMCRLFYKNGNYKVQVGRKGHGPGEYSFIRAMSFLPESQNIFLSTNEGYYLYDLNGIIKKSMPRVETPKPFMEPTTVAITDNLYLSHLVAANDFRYKALCWGQINTEQIYKLFPHSIKWDQNDKLQGFGISTCKWRFSNQIRCYWQETDTIFTIDSHLEMKKAFILDLGIYKQPLNWILTGGLTKERVISKTINVNPLINESSRYLFLQFDFCALAPEAFTYEKHNPRGYTEKINVRDVYGLFNKETGKTIILNQPVKHKYLGFKNDIDGGPCFWPKYVSSEDKMITWWTASDFLNLYKQLEKPSPALKNIAEKLTPDDNPVLMVVTLK